MRWTRWLALAATAGAMLPALVAGTVTASAADNQARVRLIQTLTMGPGLDFYIDGRRAVSNVVYKNVTTYFTVAPGDHTFTLRKAGDAAAAAPVTELKQSLDASSFGSIVAIEDADMTTKELFFSDSITTPPAGSGLLRFLHVCEQIPTVSLVPTGGAALISNIGFKQSSPYVPVQAGSLDLQLSQSDKPDNVVYHLKYDVKPGAVQTFLGIGGMGQPVEMLTVLDAASAGTAPQGSAATGAGGLVYGRALGLALLTGTLLLAGGLLALARRAPEPD